VILLRMRTPPIPIPVFQQSAVVQCIALCIGIVLQGGHMFCGPAQRSCSCPPDSQRTARGARTVRIVYLSVFSSGIQDLFVPVICILVHSLVFCLHSVSVLPPVLLVALNFTDNI
jgi:hypothetical protein